MNDSPTVAASSKSDPSAPIGLPETETNGNSGFFKTRQQLRHDLAEAISNLKSKKVKKPSRTGQLRSKLNQLRFGTVTSYPQNDWQDDKRPADPAGNV